jgi:hypothetical protein
VKAMFIDDAVEVLPAVEKNVPVKLALAVCTIGIVIIGFVTPLFQYIDVLSFVK